MALLRYVCLECELVYQYTTIQNSESTSAFRVCVTQNPRVAQRGGCTHPPPLTLFA